MNPFVVAEAPPRKSLGETPFKLRYLLVNTAPLCTLAKIVFHLNVNLQFLN